MNILYEDDLILVCVKPSGLLSQIDAAGGGSMISILEEHTGGTVFPVHRLDRETGGVMVYAKTADAAAQLSAQIAQKQMRKVYLALVHGKAPESGEMRDLLFYDRTKNKSYVVSKTRKGVKEAVLTYRTLLYQEIDDLPYSLVEVHLLTGRTHQIRVQFASRKMPLAGDRRYGAKDDFPSLGLWAYQLLFFHPTTKEQLSFVQPPKDETMYLMLGKYQNG